jgi:hypothetical protein
MRQDSRSMHSPLQRLHAARRTVAVVAGTALLSGGVVVALNDAPAEAVGPTVPGRVATTARSAAPATTARRATTSNRTTRTTVRSTRRSTATTARRSSSRSSSAAVRGDFTVSIQDESVGVPAGTSGTTRVLINPTDGFSSPVTMSPREIPDGITVRVFSPIRESARVDIAVAGDVPEGSYPVAIRGTAGGKSRTGEFTIIVGAEATSTPAATDGSTATTSPPIGGIARPIDPNASTTTLAGTPVAVTTTLVGTPTTAPAVPTTVAGPAPTDVIVSLVPAAITVAPGGTGTTAVVIAVNARETGTLTLGTSGLPAGVTGAFAPPTMLSGISTFTITVPAGTPVGTFPFTVTATAGALVRTGQGTLNIGAGGTATTVAGATTVPGATTTTVFGATTTTVFGATTTTTRAAAPASGDLNIAVSSAAVSAVQGTSQAVTVNVSGSLAIGSLVSVAGAPATVSVLTAPNPVTSGVATVTFFVNPGAPPSSSPITITVRNGAITRQAQLILTTT